MRKIRALWDFSLSQYIIYIYRSSKIFQDRVIKGKPRKSRLLPTLSVTMLYNSLQFNISNLYTVAKRSGHTGS